MNLKELKHELRLAENVAFDIHERMVDATKRRDTACWERLNDNLRDAQAYVRQLEDQIRAY